MNLKKNNNIRRTKISYIVDIPKIADEAFLCFAESERHLPFKIKRFYFIWDVDDAVVRGKHAHRKTVQMAFCIQGKVKMILDNGYDKEEVVLDRPNRGLFLDRIMWHEMVDFQKNTVLLVMASEYFDESDYIRDYDQFLAIASNGEKRFLKKITEYLKPNIKLPVWFQRNTSL